MKVALYARVSTKDQKSIPDQFAALREYADRQGWRVVAEYSEKESGKRDTRPQRHELLQRAYKGEFAVIMVWKLNRWSRSVVDALLTLAELQHRKVAFVSITEGLDLTTPVGRAMAGLLAIFAELEREYIVENVRAGVKRYRERNPDKWGRPATARAKEKEVKRLWDEGKNKSQIAAALGISRASVIRCLK